MVEKTTGMTFEEALGAMKMGEKVRRKGCRGFLFFEGDEIHEHIEGRVGSSFMAVGGEDMLAIDWEVVTESSEVCPKPETVKLWPIQVDSDVIGYGVGQKNAKRISYAVDHLKGFFSDDLCEPNVILLAEIEVELPK